MFTISFLIVFYNCFISFAVQIELLHCTSWLSFAMVLLDMAGVISASLVTKQEVWDLQQPRIPSQTSIKNHNFGLLEIETLNLTSQHFAADVLQKSYISFATWPSNRLSYLAIPLRTSFKILMLFMFATYSGKYQKIMFHCRGASKTSYFPKHLLLWASSCLLTASDGLNSLWARPQNCTIFIDTSLYKSCHFYPWWPQGEILWIVDPPSL